MYKLCHDISATCVLYIRFIITKGCDYKPDIAQVDMT